MPEAFRPGIISRAFIRKYGGTPECVHVFAQRIVLRQNGSGIYLEASRTTRFHQDFCPVHSAGAECEQHLFSPDLLRDRGLEFYPDKTGKLPLRIYNTLHESKLNPPLHGKAPMDIFEQYLRGANAGLQQRMQSLASKTCNHLAVERSDPSQIERFFDFTLLRKRTKKKEESKEELLKAA